MPFSVEPDPRSQVNDGAAAKGFCETARGTANRPGDDLGAGERWLIINDLRIGTLDVLQVIHIDQRRIDDLCAGWLYQDGISYDGAGLLRHLTVRQIWKHNQHAAGLGIINKGLLIPGIHFIGAERPDLLVFA